MTGVNDSCYWPLHGHSTCQVILAPSLDHLIAAEGHIRFASLVVALLLSGPLKWVQGLGVDPLVHYILQRPLNRPPHTTMVAIGT